MSRLNFKLEATTRGSRARAGSFTTLNSRVETPVFMPVGTQATVKGLNVTELAEPGSQVLLANTYHLLLRPGPDVFRHFGGIHKFMGWSGSVLTDSGGFQIFSLPNARRITEHGASFKSYLDGRQILLSPEASIETQIAIGADIMMVLDQCVPSTSPFVVAKAAMDLTHRWAARSLAARGDSPQSMFGIVQGALFPELRRQSAEVLCEMPFDGIAIGGLAVGESRSEREDFTELTTEFLPQDRPRYLMGVGTPIDLLEAVHRGVDMFDCILPTALAQHGVAFTSQGRLRLRRSVYKFDEQPIDASCSCLACRLHSRAYLHHLVKAQEPLAWRMLSTHNMHFYHRLMRMIRESILADRFLAFYREWREILVCDDNENPVVPPKRNRKKKPRPASAPEDAADHEEVKERANNDE